MRTGRITLLSAFFLIACEKGSETPVPPAPVAAATVSAIQRAGDLLFARSNCVACHSADASVAATAKALSALGGGSAGGGGSVGAGGGGGGAGNDGTAGYAGATGESASGQTPGSAGTVNAAGGTNPHENSGTPAEGGDGGNGAAGGNGEVKSFTQYTKLLMVFRRWQITSASFEVHATKPTASPATNIYVRIASQTGGVVTQYHAGSYHVTLPATTYISAFVP